MDTKVIHDAIDSIDLNNWEWKGWMTKKELQSLNIIINAAQEYSAICERAALKLDVFNREANKLTDEV